MSTASGRRRRTTTPRASRSSAERRGSGILQPGPGPAETRDRLADAAPGDRKAGAVAERDRTIRDFGEQWSHYGGNDGFYGSVELLQDIFGPLVAVGELEGARVADIGSGTGRIVRMLVDAGAEHVVAVEPSVGVEILKENTRDIAAQVEIVHGPGEAVPAGRDFDFVVSIGVIQFIRDPLPTLQAAREALRPGGKLVIWVYGKEGNRLYVALVQALRAVTTRLPHFALAFLAAPSRSSSTPTSSPVAGFRCPCATTCATHFHEYHATNGSSRSTTS
jgi:SAM-dependent methyltransferase